MERGSQLKKNLRLKLLNQYDTGKQGNGTKQKEHKLQMVDNNNTDKDTDMLHPH